MPELLNKSYLLERIEFLDILPIVAQGTRNELQEHKLILTVNRLVHVGLWAFFAYCLCFFLQQQQSAVQRSADFSHLWAAGHMWAEGDYASLYDKAEQEVVLDASLRGSVLETLGDSEKLSTDGTISRWWWTDRQTKVGSLYYPPFMALLYSPLGALSVSAAAELMTYLNLGLAFLLALTLHHLCERRIWFLACAVAVFTQVSFLWNFILGQNGIFSAVLLGLGALCYRRGFGLSAGVVWSILLFKPSWFGAIGVCILVLREWRVLFGLSLGASAAFLLTAFAGGFSVWINYFTLLPELLKLSASSGFSSTLDDGFAYFWKASVGIPFGAALVFYLSYLALLRKSVVWSPEVRVLALPGFALLCNPHVLHYDSVPLIFLGFACFLAWREAESVGQRSLLALVALLPWISAMTRTWQIDQMSYSLQHGVAVLCVIVLSLSQRTSVLQRVEDK